MNPVLHGFRVPQARQQEVYARNNRFWYCTLFGLTCCRPEDYLPHLVPARTGWISIRQKGALHNYQSTQRLSGSSDGSVPPQ
jgi:hypothetical protein